MNPTQSTPNCELSHELSYEDWLIQKVSATKKLVDSKKVPLTDVKTVRLRLKAKMKQKIADNSPS